MDHVSVQVRPGIIGQYSGMFGEVVKLNYDNTRYPVLVKFPSHHGVTVGFKWEELEVEGRQKRLI